MNRLAEMSTNSTLNWRALLMVGLGLLSISAASPLSASSGTADSAQSCEIEPDSSDCKFTFTVLVPEFASEDGSAIGRNVGLTLMNQVCGQEV
jgi:hypothetical protein